MATTTPSKRPHPEISATSTEPVDPKRAKSSEGGAIKFFGINAISQYTPSDEQFQFVEELHQKLDGKPMVCTSVYESQASEISKRITELQTKTQSLGTDRSVGEAVQNLWKEIEEHEIELDDIKNSISKAKKNCNAIMSARINATHARDHWESIKVSTYIRFDFIKRRADTLLEEFDKKKAAEIVCRQQKQQSSKNKERSDSVIILDMDESDGLERDDESEIVLEAESEIDRVFTPGKANDGGRKSTSTMKALAKKTNHAKGTKEDTKNKRGDGTGLFLEIKMINFVKGRKLDLAHWEWTPSIRKDGKGESVYGRIRCICCSYHPKSLKSITTHVATAKHKKRHIAAKETAELRKKKVKYLQPSVDKVLLQMRKLSPEVKQYRKDGVRLAASANLSMAGLNEVYESEFYNRYLL